MLEVSLMTLPLGRETKNAAAVESVSGSDNVYRIATTNILQYWLLDAAAQIQLPVHSPSVQSTTLDDVFVHYTGRQLRDAL
jgi:ABC-2 type transport system ATP-binding protein